MADCLHLKYTASLALEFVCVHSRLWGDQVPKSESECISTEMASEFSALGGGWGAVRLVANGYLIAGEVSQLDMGDRQAALGEKTTQTQNTCNTMEVTQPREPKISPPSKKNNEIRKGKALEIS